LRDARAVDLVNQFDEDSLQFAKMIDMDHICTMMRGRQFDRYAQAFLAQQPAGVVVDLGCGLDTRFDRVDNGQVTWVGVDFPEVIELRQRLLPAGPRCHLIARSALDFAWMDVVAGLNYPVIFLAEGFSTYLTEAEMKRMVLTLAERFPGSELIFDVVSPLSIWVHKFSPAIRKAQVQLHWGTNDPRTLETWKPGLHLLEVWGYFDQNEPRLGKYSWMRHVPLFANMNRILRYQLDNTPLPPGEGQG
jgi:O-methyltransferase involved in polyketide biosynthesis